MAVQAKRISQQMNRPKCSACGHPLGRTHKFCPQCGAPASSPVTRVGDSTGRSDLAVPAAAPSIGSPSLQVGGIESEALAEERRLVTVLFADMSGSTALGEGLDPEDLRRILASFLKTIARQITRYGGTVDKLIGDAVMAVFGAPLAHEDDAERAIRAGLAIQGSMDRLNDNLEREYGVRLALRIGINSGEVVAGLLADDLQSAYTVVGDTVNVAQRLESIAEPGSVVVGALTRRLAERAFELHPLPPAMVKGKSEPVAIYRVIGDQGPTLDLAPGGLLGREGELAALRDALNSAIDGRGQTVAIIAEPGAGKTRLISEFTHSFETSVACVHAHCASFDQGFPYALVADMVRGLFGIEVADSETAARAALARGFAALDQAPEAADVNVLLEALGYPAATGFDPQTRQRVLIKVIRSVVARRSQGEPLVVVLEDLHWMDAASAVVVGAMASEVPNLPCLLIGSARRGWDVPWVSFRIQLDALRELDVRTLVEQRLDGPAESNLVNQVIAKTAGNPFFVEEVLRSLQESGTIKERDGVWTIHGALDLKVPETVQEVLAARLDSLPVSARRALQRAAVIGTTFGQLVLEQVASTPTLTQDMAALEAGDFVERIGTSPEPTYAFRHPLIQEVAYGTLLQTQRRVFHGNVGQAIEDLYGDRVDDFVDDLALHYGRGDRDDKALHWLVRGGDRASSLFANDAALAMYDSALQRTGNVDGPIGPADVLERISDVKTRTGQYDDALSFLRQAREMSVGSQPQHSARLHRKVGTALALKGSYPQALTELDEGLAALGGAAELEAARISVQMGQVQSRSGNFGAARETLSRAIEIAEHLSAEQTMADGLKFLGAAMAYSGELQTATDLYERCGSIYEKLGDVVGTCLVRINVGEVYRRMGRWDEALAECDAAFVLAERVGNPSVIANIHNNVGEVYFSRGDCSRDDYMQAAAAKQRALEIATAIGSEAQAALARMGVGIAWVFSGDIARGRCDLVEAAEQFRRVGRSRYESELYRCFAYADLAERDYANALVNADRAVHCARSALDEAVAQRVLGEVTMARGDLATARELLEVSRRRLVELGDIPDPHRADDALNLIATRASFV